MDNPAYDVGVILQGCIMQAPEPATILILALGGLFLGNRK
jgi:hypothetical protein